MFAVLTFFTLVII